MEYQQLFDNYVCPGDTIDVFLDGKKFEARIELEKSLLANREAWFNGERFFCGVVVTELCEHCGGKTGKEASLWGIEANYPGYWHSPYLTRVAVDLAGEVE